MLSKPHFGQRTMESRTTAKPMTTLRDWDSFKSLGNDQIHTLVVKYTREIGIESGQKARLR